MSVGTQVDSRDIRKIVMEGGGGKGLVYGGAIKALQAIGKLKAAPNTGGVGTDPPSLPVDSIGGASSGAITCFFLALGCSSEQIDALVGEVGDYSQISKHNKFFNPNEVKRFLSFYDLPEPGLYKAVRYIEDKDGKNGRNEPCYATDVLDKHKIKNKKKGLIFTSKREVKRVKEKTSIYKYNYSIVGNFHDNSEVLYKTEKTNNNKEEHSRSNEKADSNHKIYKNEYRRFKFNLNHVMRRIIPWRLVYLKFRHKKRSSNYIEAMVFYDYDRLSKYITCLLHDRGLFSGISVRNYYVLKAKEFLKVNYQLDYDYEKVSHLTFKEMFDINHVDLRLAGCNLSGNIPVEFSARATPDLPVIDAVCCTMSIPFAFKPTFLDAIVHIEKYKTAIGLSKRIRGTLNEAEKKIAEQVDKYGMDEHNFKYKGLYVDGGTLNNLPVHLFDIEEKMDMTDRLYELYPNRDFNTALTYQRLFDPTVLPIRCADGPQPGDTHRFEEQMYNDYLNGDDGKNKEGREALLIDSETTNFKNRQKKRKNVEPYDPIVIKRTKALGNGILGSFGWMAGNLISTLLYYQEEGQLRTPYEQGQSVSLYAYDISLFDFGPIDALRNFVQMRAFIKTIMKFKDVWDFDTQAFVLNTKEEKDRYEKIKEGIKTYDPSLTDDQIPRLFKALHPFIK